MGKAQNQTELQRASGHVLIQREMCPSEAALNLLALKKLRSFFPNASPTPLYSNLVIDTGETLSRVQKFGLNVLGESKIMNQHCATESVLSTVCVRGEGI